jgi:hypothetical protein
MSENAFRVQQAVTGEEMIAVFSFFRKGVFPQARIEELIKLFMSSKASMSRCLFPEAMLFVKDEREMVVAAASLELLCCPARGMVGTIRFRVDLPDRSKRGDLRVVLLVQAREMLRSFGAQTVFVEIDRIRDAGLASHLRDAGFVSVDAGKRYKYHRQLEDQE